MTREEIIKRLDAAIDRIESGFKWNIEGGMNDLVDLVDELKSEV